MGGIRFRRSLKIAPGIRLSVSKTGLGLSAGVRGARYSLHSSGRRTTSLGIPGTGLSYVESSSGGARQRSSRGSTSGAGRAERIYAGGPQAAALLPGAGLFSGAAEKRYREGLVSYLSADRARAAAAFEASLAADARNISAHLLAAVSLDAETELPGVIHHLETLITSQAPYPDRLLLKFLSPDTSQIGIDVRITEHIAARVQFDRVGATLLLAEAYQQSDRLEEAVGLVQQLHDANPTDTAIRLSLADLLFSDDDFEGVVEAATSIGNDDDIGVGLLHLRAAALSALGHQTAAFDAFREALAKTANRDPSLLATVRYDRALAYEQAGQKGRARADLERLYAADPSYRDVRSRLAAS